MLIDYVAWTMGGIEVRYLPYGNVRNYVTVAFECASTFASANKTDYKKSF